MSNVPGPRNPLFLDGARMTHYYPVSTIIEGQGLNITVQSYMDELDFGLVACRELVPDLWHLLELCLEEIQVLLRDHHTDEIHAIDLKLVESLYRLSQTLDSRGPLHVLSAYRSPRTNARLALRYDGVAENSFHMKGKAVDLYIPGRRKRDLARAAQSLRVGGVGIYSSFVHVDTGPIRRWQT